MITHRVTNFSVDAFNHDNVGERLEMLFQLLKFRAKSYWFENGVYADSSLSVLTS